MSDRAHTAVHEAARQAYTAGICVLPPLEDGTKAPLSVKASPASTQPGPISSAATS